MELFNYLLKVSACSALFFGFYILVLRKLTFFKINRFYLLFSLLISFIIPALQFTVERTVSTPIPVAGSVTEPVELKSLAIKDIGYPTPILVNDEPELEKHIDWYTLLPYFYGCIVSCFLLLAGWRLFQLLKHTKVPIKEINGLKLVAKETGFTNCSFFNYVFVDEDGLTEEQLAVLLTHEAVHVKQYHSIDKLLMIIAKAVLWFNPIIYIYDKALEQAHEYEADEVTSQNVGTEPYANLLLQLAVSKSSNPLIHNFVKSPVKQRIKMLFNSKSKNVKKFVYLLALPIGLGLIWGFTIDTVNVFPTPNQEKEFTLVIDAGHGGKNKGTTINGVSEKEISLSISKKLKALAEQNGIKVITTRNNDSYASLQERAKAEGSFLISLHVNSQPKGNDRNGIEMFVSQTADNIKTTADKIKISRSIRMTYDLYKSMKNIEGIAVSNKPKRARLYFLENSKLPAVVLELGFLTNKKDFQFITNDKKQDELAKAIIDGVLNFKKSNKTDGEMKAMQEEVDRVSKPYMAWLKSDQRKSILAKAAKIKSKTINGKIESLHYFSSRDVLDGFILNANGERYRVYLTKEQLKQVHLNAGDPISVRANQVEAWYDSEYPVIKTVEFSSANRVAVTDKVYPKPRLVSSSSLMVNNKTKTVYAKKALMEIYNGILEAEEVEANLDWNLIIAKKAKFTKDNGAITTSDLMTFDQRTGAFSASPNGGNVETMTKAFELLSKLHQSNLDSIKASKIFDNAIILVGKIKLNIDNYSLTAKIATATKGSDIITLHLGSVKNGNEPAVIASQIEFNITTKQAYVKETSNTGNPTGKTKTSLTNQGLMTKLKYSADDSTVVSKKDQLVKLYGDARVSLDDYSLIGKRIDVNNNTKRATIYDGLITQQNGNQLNAKRIEFDLVNKQAIIDGKIQHRFNQKFTPHDHKF